MYRTCNQEYNPQSMMTDKQTPLFQEIGKDIPDHAKFLKLYKNQNVAKNWVEQPKDYVHNVFTSQDFPSHAETYKYPNQGMKVGNALYETSSMQIGKNKPAEEEIPQKYYPRDKSFTDNFLGGAFKQNSLNTAVAFSKVHTNLDEY